MDIKEVFKSNFTIELKKEILRNFDIALKAWQSFVYEEELKEDESFFQYPLKSDLYGRLRTYAIKQQFYLRSFDKSAPYNLVLTNTNKFGGNALALETSDFIMHLGQTRKSGLLLPKAKYKAEMAKVNKDIELQIEFDFMKDGSTVLREEKKYAIIGYGYNKNSGLTHLDAMIPDSNYNSLILYEDIFKSYRNDSQLMLVPDEYKEDEIVNLKKGIKKIYYGEN